MAKKTYPTKLKGGLNLYGVKPEGLAGVIHILAESFEDAIIVFREEYKTELVSITKLQEKIQIKIKDE